MAGFASWLLDTIPQWSLTLFVPCAIALLCFVLARLLVVLAEAGYLARETPSSRGRSVGAVRSSASTSGVTATGSSARALESVAVVWCCRSSGCRPTCSCRSRLAPRAAPNSAPVTFTLTCSAHERSRVLSRERATRMFGARYERAGDIPPVGPVPRVPHGLDGRDSDRSPLEGD